jgi:pteridine reductase
MLKPVTMDLQRVALITGSGKRRVGWHVAAALADRGYALGIHYHRSRQEAQETVAEFCKRQVDVEAFAADLVDEPATKEMVARVRDRFGRIDVLVNCAATWTSQRLEDVTANDVRRFFEINLLGTFLVSQQVGLAMVAQPEGGSVVLIGDWATARPYLNHAAYFASKGSIPTLTRCLAVELGSRNPNVRVNCILPGPVMLPPDLPAVERAQAVAGTLVKREGKPDNIAQAVIHFIENDFVTGVCLPVDGGRTIYAE